MNKLVFKIAPEYTIAHHFTGSDCVCLDEWAGKSLGDFSAAIGRAADSVESINICGRVITEYTWSN